MNLESRALQTPASPLMQIVPDFEKIDGWLGLNGAELLFAAAAAVKVGCIIEVGSYRGRSTVALCAGSSVGAKIPVYAIEPHEHFIGVKGGVFGPNDRRAFFRTILTTKFARLVRLINANSQTIGPGWDKPVSLLFIDGDHRYEAVLSDFTIWRPHLVDGAIVIFQDAHGTGPALVIKDHIHSGMLAHVQTVGQIAMFRFNVIDGPIDPWAIQHTNVTSIYPDNVLPLPATEFASMPQTIGRRVYYSARNKYLYQPIPGCAGITIKTVLLELEGLPIPAQLESKKHNKFPGIETLAPGIQLEILQGQAKTFNFTVVRDPYSRLASVYANKIARGYVNGNYYWIELIKQAAAAQDAALSDRITFEEFVHIISAQPENEMDPHWRHQYHEGAFALIKYDFVGRTEMLSTDFAYILEQIHAPQEIMHKAFHRHNASGASLALWSEVSAPVRAAFLKTFTIDFDALRYPMRHSSVLFSVVNVDRPAPVPLVRPAGKTAKQYRLQGKDVSSD